MTIKTHFFILLTLAFTLPAHSQSGSDILFDLGQYYYSEEFADDYIKGECSGGICKNYYRSGELYQEINKNTEYSIWYFKNGKIMTKELSENGEIKEQMHWYEDGSKKAELKMIDHILEIENYWDQNGNLIVSNGNGMLTLNYSNGQTERQGKYNNGKKEGIWIFRYSNGKIKEQGRYIQSKKEGEWIGFDKDGIRDFVELYKDGQLIKGTRFHAEKDSVVYYNFMAEVSYPGGMRGFQIDINEQIKNLKNKDLKKLFKKTQGRKIIVEALIEKNGEIKEAFIRKGIHPELDMQILKAVKNTPKKWSPALHRGIVVKRRVLIPFVFGN